MNKIYKLVWSRLQERFVVASELIKSRRPSSGCDLRVRGDRRATHPVAVWLMLLCSTPFALVRAEELPMVAAETGVDPHVLTTSNGTPMINIVPPNERGLSHNKYSRFDVDERGVVFNNAVNGSVDPEDRLSKIGGGVVPNTRLTESAKVVLNEVTSARDSSLRGTLEINGKRADLIIANPNGITVNGVSTLNTGQLWLVGGAVTDASGAFPGMAVQQGEVMIEGEGINTDGLTQLQVIAKAIELNAPVGTSSLGEQPADVTLHAGSARVEPDRAVKAANEGQGAGKGIAISGSALGSIYGGYVNVISTDRGLGVHHEGLITSHEQIRVLADGSVEIDSIEARPNERAAHGVLVEASGDVTLDVVKSIGVHAGGDAPVSLTSAQHMALGKVSSTGDVTVRADTLSATELAAGISHSDTVSTDGSVNVVVAGNAELKDLVAVEDITVSAGSAAREGSLRVNRGALVAGRQIQLSSSAETVLENSRATAQRVELNAASAQLSHTEIKSSTPAPGSQSASQVLKAIKIDVTGPLQLNGDVTVVDREGKVQEQLRVENGVIVDADGKAVENTGRYTLKYTSGLFAGTGELSLNSTAATLGTAYLNGANIGIVAKSLDNSAYIEQLDRGELRVEAESVTNKGTLLAQSALRLRTKKAAGSEPGDSDQGKLDNRGVIQGDETVALHVDGDLLNSGSLNTLKKTNSEMTIDASGQFENRAGAKINTQALDLRAAGWVNSGQVDVSEQLAANITGDTQQSGKITALKGMAISAENFTASAGSETNTQRALMEIDARDRFDVRTGAQLYSIGGIDVDAGYADINGSLRGIGYFDERPAIWRFSTSSPIDINARRGFNGGEQMFIESTDAIHITAAQELTVRGQLLAGVLRNKVGKAGTVKLNTDGVLSMSSPTPASGSEPRPRISGTAIELKGDQVNIGRDLLMQAVDQASVADSGEIEIKAATALNNAGALRAATEIAVDAPTVHHGQAGVSPGSAVINAPKVHIETSALHLHAPIDADHTKTKSGCQDSDKDAQGYCPPSSSQAPDLTIEGVRELHNPRYTGEQSGRTHNLVSTGTATLKLNPGQDLNINAGRLLPKSRGQLTVEANNIVVDSGHVVANPGAIALQAAGGLSNYGQIQTAGNLDIDAGGNVENAASRLIWAGGDIGIDAVNLNNNENSHLSSLGSMLINVAGTIDNNVGHIESGGDMQLNASSLRNRIQRTVYDQGYREQEFSQPKEGSILAEVTDETAHGYLYSYWRLHGINLIEPNVSVDRGKIASNANMRLGSDDRPMSVTNQSIITAGGEMIVRGDIDLRAPSYQYTVGDYLQEATLDLGMTDGHGRHRNIPNWVWDTKSKNIKEVLDYVFREEQYEGNNYCGRHYLKYVRCDLAWKKTLVGEVSRADDLFSDALTAVFGSDYASLSWKEALPRWKKYSTNRNNIMRVSYGDKKPEMYAGGGVNHRLGSLTLGEQLVQPGSRQNTVTINGKTVRVDEPGPRVDMSLPSAEEVLEVALAGLSQMATASFNPASESAPNHSLSELLASASQFPTKQGIRPTVVPLFETDLAFIDTSSFVGSTAFFNAMGYNPELTINVVGDQYIEQKLIEKQIEDRVGSFIAQRERLQDMQLVTAMVGNAAEEARRLGLQVGVAPTAEQLANLEKDIVWYEYIAFCGDKPCGKNQTSNKYVLTPRVYLAESTMMAFKKSRGTASAVLAAAGDIDVDAENVISVDGKIVGDNVKIVSKNKAEIEGFGDSAGVEGKSNVVVRAKNDVNIVGATIKGTDVEVESVEKDVNISAKTRAAGATGTVVGGTSGVIAKNNATVKAEKGTIRTKGGKIKAKNDVAILSKNDVEMSVVNTVDRRRMREVYDNASGDGTKKTPRNDKSKKNRADDHDNANSLKNTWSTKANGSLIEAGGRLKLRSSEGGINQTGGQIKARQSDIVTAKKIVSAAAVELSETISTGEKQDGQNYGNGKTSATHKKARWDLGVGQMRVTGEGEAIDKGGADISTFTGKLKDDDILFLADIKAKALLEDIKREEKKGDNAEGTKNISALFKNDEDALRRLKALFVKSIKKQEAAKNSPAEKATKQKGGTANVAGEASQLTSKSVDSTPDPYMRIKKEADSQPYDMSAKNGVLAPVSRTENKKATQKETPATASKDDSRSTRQRLAKKIARRSGSSVDFIAAEILDTVFFDITHEEEVSAGFTDKGFTIGEKNEYHETAVRNKLKGNISFEATEGDVNLTSDDVEGDNLFVKAERDVNFGAAEDVHASSKKSNTSSFLANRDNFERENRAKENGTKIDLTNKLTFVSGGDTTFHGGEVNASSTDGEAGGDIITIAEKDEYSIEKRENVFSFELGAAAGAGGAGANVSLGADGSKAETRTHGDTSAGASASLAIKNRNSRENRKGKKYSNANLNFGGGTVKAGGVFDIGGADINKAYTNENMDGAAAAGRDKHMPTLNITAARIESTKFEDEETVDREVNDSSLTLGAATQDSATRMATMLGNNYGLTDEQKQQGYEIDPAMVAAQQAALAAEVAGGVSAGVSGSLTLSSSHDMSNGTRRKQNINTLGGNLNIKTTEGGMNLKGVVMDGGDIDIDSAGEVVMTAAESSFTETTESHSASVGASMSASCSAGPTGPGCGAGASLDVSYDGSKSSRKEKTYENARIKGKNVNIKVRSGGMKMTGANVEGDNVKTDITGDLVVESVQDTVEFSKDSWGANQSLGASVNSKTLVAPTVTTGVRGGKSWDKSRKVGERSGIVATNKLELDVTGDATLTGATIASESGNGYVNIDGDLTTEELKDSQDKDGFRAGGSVGIDEDASLTISLEGGRDDAIKYGANQKSAIQIANLNVKGERKGSFVTDIDKATDVTKDKKIKGWGVDLSFEIKSEKAKAKERQAEIDAHNAEILKKMEIEGGGLPDRPKKGDGATVDRSGPDKPVLKDAGDIKKREVDSPEGPNRREVADLDIDDPTRPDTKKDATRTVEADIAEPKKQERGEVEHKKDTTIDPVLVLDSSEIDGPDKPPPDSDYTDPKSISITEVTDTRKDEKPLYEKKPFEGAEPTMETVEVPVFDEPMPDKPTLKSEGKLDPAKVRETVEKEDSNKSRYQTGSIAVDLKKIANESANDKVKNQKIQVITQDGVSVELTKQQIVDRIKNKEAVLVKSSSAGSGSESYAVMSKKDNSIVSNTSVAEFLDKVTIKNQDGTYSNKEVDSKVKENTLKSAASSDDKKRFDREMADYNDKVNSREERKKAHEQQVSGELAAKKDELQRKYDSEKREFDDKRKAHESAEEQRYQASKDEAEQTRSHNAEVERQENARKNDIEKLKTVEASNKAYENEMAKFNEAESKRKAQTEANAAAQADYEKKKKKADADRAEIEAHNKRLDEAADNDLETRQAEQDLMAMGENEANQRNADKMNDLLKQAERGEISPEQYAERAGALAADNADKNDVVESNRKALEKNAEIDKKVADYEAQVAANEEKRAQHEAEVKEAKDYNDKQEADYQDRKTKYEEDVAKAEKDYQDEVDRVNKENEAAVEQFENEKNEYDAEVERAAAHNEQVEKDFEAAQEKYAEDRKKAVEEIAKKIIESVEADAGGGDDPANQDQVQFGETVAELIGTVTDKGKLLDTEELPKKNTSIQQMEVAAALLDATGNPAEVVDKLKEKYGDDLKIDTDQLGSEEGQNKFKEELKNEQKKHNEETGRVKKENARRRALAKKLKRARERLSHCQQPGVLSRADCNKKELESMRDVVTELGEIFSKEDNGAPVDYGVIDEWFGRPDTASGTVDPPAPLPSAAELIDQQVIDDAVSTGSHGGVEGTNASDFDVKNRPISRPRGRPGSRSRRPSRSPRR